MKKSFVCNLIILLIVNNILQKIVENDVADSENNFRRLCIFFFHYAET